MSFGCYVYTPLDTGSEVRAETTGTEHHQHGVPSKPSSSLSDGSEQPRPEPSARGGIRRVGRRSAGAAIDAARNECRIVGIAGLVSDDLGLRPDERIRTPVTNGKQAAEVVDDFIGVHTDRIGVIAEERACEQPAWPE